VIERERIEALGREVLAALEVVSAQVPALAFYLLASLAPLVLGLGAISAITFPDVLDPGRVSAELSGIFPPQLRDDIATLAGRVREQSFQLLTLSILAMLWSSSAALGVIARTMTALAGVRPYPWLRARLRLMAIGMLFAFLVIAASALASLAGGLLPAPAWILVPANALGMGAILMVIYRLVSPLRPPLRRLAASAAPAAVVLQAAPLLTGAYLELSASRLSPTGLFFGLAALLAATAIVSSALLVGAALAARAERPADRGIGPAAP